MNSPEKAFDFKKILSGSISDQLASEIKSGRKVLSISGLKGGSKYLVTYLISEIEPEKKVVYITRDQKNVEYQKDNISAISRTEVPAVISRNLKKSSSLFDKKNLEQSSRVDGFIRSERSRIICTDLTSLFEITAPPALFKESSLLIKKDTEIDRDELCNSLFKIGYSKTDFVERFSEFSMRGSIIDIFSPGYDYPYRLEFFGDSINSIRYFDPSSQKSVNKVDSVVIYPSSFLIFEDKYLNSALKNIEEKATAIGLTSSERASITSSVKKGLKIDEAEWLLPFFYNKRNTLLDYFEDPILIFDEEYEIESETEALENLFENRSGLPKTLNRIMFDFNSYYISDKEFKKRTSENLKITVNPVTKTRENIVISSREVGIESNSVKSLVNKIKELQKEDFETYIFSYSKGEKDKLAKILDDYSLDNVNNQTGALSEGFILPDFKIAVITENEIVGKSGRKTKNFSRFKDIPSAFITSFSELRPGDFIVHKEFGIGKFVGLKRMNFNGSEGDFIECEYRDNDKIFVPVEKLKLIQRYIGDSKKPVVEKLGSNNWKKTVKKVEKAVENIARELLELYARRKTEKGFKFSLRDQIFNEFEISFPFDETDDQTNAIEDVMRDMESEKPMDRLICGDVGFGKTEVALRAAFKAAMDGKQVTFLAPTTLLASQHFQKAKERLREYPVEIDMLTRFKSSRQEKDIHSRIQDGTLDIIIGTHKLLSKKINFNNLGLIIIDEEQKFGVKHKEHLRSIKPGVDVLALSATPIPRTLQLSMTDIRDISLINTPPDGRRPVEVYVQNFNPDAIRKAVLNEISRGGTTFFIHNRIEKIFEIADYLKELIPEASIAVTHGRMNEKTLEKTLENFISGEINLLVTTAIVESGLDIANANTIIVNDAHTFGLADLYQLKGRVGRSNVEAYSYFLIPSLNSLTPDARKRLEMLSELTELGSGFKLALSDLEIRGAGNLFGKEQSGHIGDVGLEFFLELLKSTISRIKNETTVFDYEPEIKTSEDAFIPDEYIESSAQRLFYYKKISSIQKKYEIKELQTELEDKFGKMPEPLQHLVRITEIKILLKEALIERVDILRDKAVITFLEFSPYAKLFRPSRKYKVMFDSKNRYQTLKQRINDILNGKIKTS